jgi:hypothetical protein
VLETRLNALLIAVAGMLWLGLRAHAPHAVEAPFDAEQLAYLEDASARDRSNVGVMVALAEAYIEHGYPTLAVAAIRDADARVLEEPRVTHELARAYEEGGRMLDALATADLALARCARAVGSHALETGMPRYACNERTLAKLDTHKSALERMVRWGVVDPRQDPRTQRAYDLALRRARVALGDSGARVESNSN